MISVERLERLQELREEIGDLLREEEELLTPQRMDVGNIEIIYVHFNRILGGLPASFLIPDDRARRKIFIFIVLYLYSPGALAGRYMERNIRNTLMAVLGVKSKSTINYYCQGLMVWYYGYAEFRELIDYIFAELEKSFIPFEMVKS